LDSKYKIAWEAKVDLSLGETARGRIRRTVLHQEVAERLRDLIIEGTLEPGQRINERVVCDSFGISRTPLREALLVLAGEGLVELLPRRGARVARLGPAQIRDVLELLGGIEALAGELACARATDQIIAGIQERHARMLECYRRGEMLEYFKLNESIHDAIVGAAGNRALVEAHRPLRTRVLRALYLPNARAERWRAAVAEHEAFITALQDRDGPRLAALLREHKERTWQELRGWLEHGHAEDGRLTTKMEAEP
jgi:DNA-binding GntR family transcriptional regulator